MKNDEYYMKKALLYAKKASLMDEVPVGAIMIYQNNIIATGYNKKETSKSVMKHAELICIEKASKKLNNWRLDGCTLYVTLEPCPMCASAIQQSRIDRVVFGACSKNVKNNQIVDKIFNEIDANSSVKTTSGVLMEDCGKILSDFFEKKRQ